MKRPGPLDGNVVALRRVPDATGGQASQDLVHEQTFLLLDLLQDTLVLLGSPREVREYLLYGTVRDVLVCRITGLTWKYKTSYIELLMAISQGKTDRGRP